MPSASTGIGASDNLASSRPRRVRENLGPPPRLFAPRGPNTERQTEAAAEAAGNDDLGRRTLDAARQRKIRRDLAPQFQLAARIRIDRGALISARTACARILASSLAGKVSCEGTPIWKMAGPAVSS